jgi:hypothetical protein
MQYVLPDSSRKTCKSDFIGSLAREKRTWRLRYLGKLASDLPHFRPPCSRYTLLRYGQGFRLPPHHYGFSVSHGLIFLLFWYRQAEICDPHQT